MYDKQKRMKELLGEILKSIQFCLNPEVDKNLQDFGDWPVLRLFESFFPKSIPAEMLLL